MIVKRNEPKFDALRAIVHAVDHAYLKHSIICFIANEETLGGTYWDGGSRSTYHMVDVSGSHPCRTHVFPQFAPPQFGGPRTTPVVPIANGHALVETGIFCGKSATAIVTLTRKTFAGLPS